MTNCLQPGFQRCPGRCIPASGKGVHQSKEMMPARVLEPSRGSWAHREGGVRLGHGIQVERA